MLSPHFREEMVPLITRFIADTFEDTGREIALVGLSGGVDSALVAKLCAEALGPRRVHTMHLPEEPDTKDEGDARAFAKTLGVRFDVTVIGPLIKAFESYVGTEDRKLLGNVKARIRMIILYHHAGLKAGLVVGTGNKSEIALAYTTKFGDGAADLLPIGDLYKTQVWEMARHLGLPKAIVDKVPTAGLWKGQTDEGELGITYRELDSILLGFEMQLPQEEVARRTGLARGKVKHVADLVRIGAHKRKMPPIPKLGIRTFGLDWRE